MNAALPTYRWSAIRLLNWYENASLEEVYAAIDPIIYNHRPAELAKLVGSSIDVIYSFRKKCIRSKVKPNFILFIRILAVKE